MAQTIKLRRSATAGATPTTSQLELGEVAINTYDGKMYIKKNVGGTESIVELGSGLTPADAIFVEYLYTATASQTAFSGNDDNSAFLSYEVGAIQVFLNGILLDPETDYTATNGALITLASAAAVDDYLQIFAFKKKISDGNVTVDTFSGNNSTTAFTLTLDPGDENNTRVFIDGVYQSKSNYSVSGTTLTFSTAPPSGTAIEVEIGNRNVTLDTTANLDFPDNVKLRLGTSQDLEIYHDASDSLINDNGTGSLKLQTGGSTKLEVTSTGVDVTGNIAVSGTVDGVDIAARDAVLTSTTTTAGAALPRTGGAMTGAITTNSTFDGRDVATDGAKLDGIESGATADQTQSEINALGITATGLSGTPAISVANITTTGELRGPASFVVDPAAVGDNTGTVIIKGNLQVDGATTTINSTTLTVDDLNLTLASGAANGTAANGAGITVDGASATLTYQSTGDNWAFNKNLDVTGSVTADGVNVPDGEYLRFNTNGLTLRTNANNAYIVENSGGKLAIQASNLELSNTAGTQTYAYFSDGGSSQIFYNNNKKLETTNTGIDVTGTATVDALTSSGTIKAETTFGGFLILKRNDTTLTNNADIGSINFEQTDSDDAGVPVNILASGDGTAGGGKLRFYTGTPTSRAQRQTIYSNGDIEFYEDTGTTAKFFWDASAERLGIGDSSPDGILDVEGSITIAGSQAGVIFNPSVTPANNSVGSVGLVSGTLNAPASTNANSKISGLRVAPTTSGSFNGAGEFAGIKVETFNGQSATLATGLYVDAPTGGDVNYAAILNGGNVGIGTSNPDDLLVLSKATYPTVKLNDTGLSSSLILQTHSGTSEHRLTGTGAYPLVFRTNDTERMRIDSSGNVNIGNGIAEEKRLIIDCSNPVLVLKETDQAVDSKVWATQSIASKLYFRAMNDALSSATDVMILDRSGNVGIGTTPVTHYTGYEALDIGNTLSLMSNNTSTNISTLTNNGYLNSNASNWVRKVEDESTMYEQVSGQHRFKTAASGSAGGAITWSEKMRIDESGNVGIGTDAPGYLLTVKKDVDSFIMKVENDGNSPGTSGASYADASDGLWVDTRWNTATNTPFKVTSNSGTTPMMIIKGNGNVGIGNTGPANKLSIGQNLGAGFAITADSGTPYGMVLQTDEATPTNNPNFWVRTNDGNAVSTLFRIQNNGNVGIGTSSPDYLLDIENTSGNAIARLHSGTSRSSSLRLQNDAQDWDVNLQTNDKFAVYDHTAGTQPFTIMPTTGNVGIGTITPTAKLHTKETVSNTISAATAGVKFDGSGGDGLAFGNKQSSPYTSWIQAGYLLDGYSPAFNNGYPIALNPIGGNVGIGTDSPNQRLEVNGNIGFSKNGTDGNRYLLIDGADATYAGTMNIQAGFGSTSAGGAIKLYAHAHATYPGSVWIGRSASSSGNIMFGNGGTGPASTAQIQMAINPAGNLLVGTLSAGEGVNYGSPGVTTIKGSYGAMIKSTGGTGYEALSLWNSAASGTMIQVYFRDGSGGTGRGSITTNGSGTQYNTTSDLRLKENIKTIDNSTEKLMAMNPVTHTWKARPEANAVHGFIAQEMMNIVPEAVVGDPEGEEMMGMDYGRITPVIVAALQDALKEIKELKTRINELESK